MRIHGGHTDAFAVDEANHLSRMGREERTAVLWSIGRGSHLGFPDEQNKPAAPAGSI